MSLDRFCRRPIVQAGPRETVLDAAARMREQHVGAVVVVDQGRKPIGMLTDRDIVLRVVLERRDPATTPIGSVMSENVTTVRDSDAIDTVVRKMREAAVRRVPIVSADGAVIGLCALDDLFVLFTGELGAAAEAVRSNRGP